MKVVIAVIASKQYEDFLSNWKSIKVPENIKIYYIFGSKEPVIETLEDTQTYLETINSILSSCHSIQEGLDRIIRNIGSPEVRHGSNGTELWIQTPECIMPGIHLKTKAAFTYILENEEFDILIRSNLSSMFDLKRLYAWLQDKPIYNSSFGSLTFDSFLSGCGYGLTRDVVEDFCKTEISAHDIMVLEDDLVLHKYLTLKKVPRYCWDMQKYEIKGDLQSFHIRFKTENRQEDAIEQFKYIRDILQR
jgi:hypothetical protein